MVELVEQNIKNLLLKGKKRLKQEKKIKIGKWNADVQRKKNKCKVLFFTNMTKSFLNYE